jgi:hypothetical protein
MVRAVFPGWLNVRTSEPYRLPEGNFVGEPVTGWPGGFRVPELTAPRALYQGIVISDGLVRVGTGYIQGSTILANGDVTTGQFLDSSVVVCDGEVRVTEHVSGSIVIARGDIVVGRHARESVLIAGGKVKLGDPKRLNEDRVTVVRENVRRPLDFVSFFELSDVGVEVAGLAKTPFEGELYDRGVSPVVTGIVFGNGVRVTRLTAGKPFAAAGVREGDVITRVGEVAVDSPAALRRLVRDASATKGEAVLTVRRNDTTSDIRVPIPD